MPRTCAGTNRNQLNKTKKREAVEREVRALESAVRVEPWPLVLLPDLPDGAEWIGGNREREDCVLRNGFEGRLNLAIRAGPQNIRWAEEK